MSLHVAMASIAEDPMVIARAEAAVAAAADHLKVPPPELTPAALGHQLANLTQRLEQRIALPSDPTDDWATTAEILISILRLQCELLDHDLARRVKSMSEIRNALGYLRGSAAAQNDPRRPEGAEPGVCLRADHDLHRARFAVAAPARAYRRRRGRSPFAISSSST